MIFFKKTIFLIRRQLALTKKSYHLLYLGLFFLTKSNSWGDSIVNGFWLATGVNPSPSKRTPPHFLGELRSRSSSWKSNRGWKRCNRSWLVFFTDWGASHWLCLISSRTDVLRHKMTSLNGTLSNLKSFCSEICLPCAVVTSHHSEVVLL